MSDRVVITGMGVVSPIGIGSEVFWTGLEKGRSGIRTGPLFEHSSRTDTQAAPVRDFQVADYFSKMGLTCLSRTAEMICAAASLARASCPLDYLSVDPADVGVVIGTAYGNVESMVQFSEGIYTDGPRFVNPRLFPNTVLNASAGYVSILLENRGLNITIASGGASGLDAIIYAAEALQREEAQVIFAGGGEALSLFTYMGFRHSGQLAPSDHGAPAYAAPFDRRRNGFLLGEGAAILVLEKDTHAQARGAPILAELAGWGHGFVPSHGQATEERKVAIQAKAMRQALQAARLTPEDISYIAASANGSIRGDRLEAKAIRAVFPDQAAAMPIAAFKSMLGESFGAAGAMQAAGAVLSLHRDAVPPTPDFEDGDADTALAGICRETRYRPCRAVMVNAFNPTKNCSTVILKKVESAPAPESDQCA